MKKVYRNGCLVAIGASAGGIEPLLQIISDLPQDIEATFVIALHRPVDLPSQLDKLLSRNARIEVIEPEDEKLLHCATIYVPAPAEILRAAGHQISVTPDEKGLRRMQRIDDLFMSVARSGANCPVGVLLSGSLADGVAGLKAIDQQGGVTIVQQPEDAKFSSLPNNALQEISPTYIASAAEIGPILCNLAERNPCHWVYRS